MAFRIERNDITKVHTEAIVNTANPMPTYGSGTDTAVYEAAGMAQLLAERKKIGVIERGQSAYTPAFNLQNTNGIKYIIHTVGTRWKDGQHGEIEIMRNCYRSSLQIAKDLNCKSLSIPLLAMANFALNPSDMFETVVKYCVTQKIYDVMQVDSLLFQMDLPCFND